ncbi:hypothetical protein [Amycolatopsis sp. NPDC059657]|uniref:aa3-type cytochrome oxidase subunit CtaJ n=1 Tax=Amycolatopsis sp. NPDC059657 TaxID=3346899 RepID=UPI003671A6B2
MNLVETIVVFVAIPAAIYFLFGALTLRSKGGGTPRYRPGQQWDYPPLWWTANPEGVGHHATAAPAENTPTVKGGARGNW